jgi:hypothetical protein
MADSHTGAQGLGESRLSHFPNYAKGTWGPAAADLFMKRDGHSRPLPTGLADQENKKIGPGRRLFP